MLIIFLIISSSLLSKQVEMIKLKQTVEFETVDSKRKDGYNKVILDNNIISPFIVLEKQKGLYLCKLPSFITLPIDLCEGIDYLKFDEKDVEKVKVDISIWEKGIPNSKEGLKSFHKNLMNFIKKKNKAERDFHNFIFIHELIIKYSHLPKDEYLDSLIFNFFSDRSIDSSYKLIFLRNAPVYEPLIMYKILFIKILFDIFAEELPTLELLEKRGIFLFEGISKERSKFLNKNKLKHPVVLDNIYEVKAFALMIKNIINRYPSEISYPDVLFSLKSVINFHKVEDELKKIYDESINEINAFLECLIKRDAKNCIKFINKNNIFLSQALILNLIETAGSFEEAIKVREFLKNNIKNNLLFKDEKSKDFFFQFLPFSRFLITSKEIFCLKDKNLNEFVISAMNVYKKEMKIDNINEGNQIFRYISDYYTIKQAVNYSDGAKDKNYDLFIFSALESSIINKDIYVKEIKNLDNNLVKEAYFAFLCLQTSVDLDNLIFSKIAENPKFLELLKSYVWIYRYLIDSTKELSENRDFNFDWELKRAFTFIISDDLEYLERAKDIVIYLMTEYYANVDQIYKILNRAFIINSKKNSDFKNKSKEIEELLKKYKK